jgi:hypothetical protein
METNVEDHDSDDSEDNESDDEDNEEKSKKARKKRVSGLMRLTGKPKAAADTRTTPKKKKTTAVEADDEKTSPKQATSKKSRSRPRKNTKDAAIEILETVECRPSTTSAPGRKKSSASGVLDIPDSAGEEDDVWIISSD